MADQQTPVSERHKALATILRDLNKVVKVVAMYPEGNPLPQSLRQSVAEKLVQILDEHGQFCVETQPGALVCDNETLYRDPQGEEGLAAILYSVGIASLTFVPGLDGATIYRFLDIIKAHQNAGGKHDDLVTRFWEADLPNLKISSAEDVALADYEDIKVQEIVAERTNVRRRRTSRDLNDSGGYAMIFVNHEADAPRGDEDSDDSGGGDDVAVQAERPEAFLRAVLFENEPAPARTTGVDADLYRVSEAAQAMGLNDLVAARPRTPDTTLILNDEFKLSEEQEQEISVLLAEDAQFDVWESTVEICKEMLHQEPEMINFFESVAICEQVQQALVQNGRLNEAGQLLRYFGTLENELRGSRALWADRLKEARFMLGTKEKFRTLIDMLNADPEISAGELRRYLDHFSWEAMAAITDMLGDLSHATHRRSLCDFLIERGKDNLQMVSKGIFDKRWYVVRNSVTILARIGDSPSLRYLRRVTDHEDKRVRLELGHALVECPNPEALDILAVMVRDPDKEVRTLAIDAVVKRGGRSGFDTMRSLVTDPAFPSYDQGEQILLLKAFSALGGVEALPHLKTLVSRFNPLRDQLVEFSRAAAFEALTVNRSDEAEKYLLKLRSSWRSVIRAKARTAVEQRRIYLLEHLLD